MKRIVWDWNGTLFNDLDLCFECINRLLVNHDQKPLSDLNHYKDIFGFPIYEYYQKAGFDFSQVSFDILAHEYMEDYQAKSYDCKLHDDVISVLQKAKEYKIPQVILSASKKDYLLKQINEFDIDEYIDSIYGIEDIYATSKLELAKYFIQSCHPSDDVWFVGDSLHDKEVAESVGANCALVCTGHQSKHRLQQEHELVFDSLLESLEYIYERD